MSGGSQARRRVGVAALEIKAGPDGVFEGYAAVFETPDLNGDVVAPGAFEASLARRGRGGVRLLYQHAAAEPLGAWRRLEEDSRGLFCQGALILENARAREVWSLLKAGAVDGLSIGFETVRAKPAPNGGRRLIEIDLWEVSLVTFPMAPQARVTRVGDAGEAAAAITQAAAQIASLSTS